MNFDLHKKHILKAALEVYGEDEQHSMAIGECGEFLTLYGRKVQGRDSKEEWVSEIADVIIIMEQIATMVGYDEVSAKIDQKMQRLEARLERNGYIFDKDSKELDN